MSTQLESLTPGTLINKRYKLIARIGSGGMADVWAAHDTLLDRKVAIKLLHGRYANDKEFAERFRREASHAAGLQHPNIVGVYDRGEWGGTFYIVMEFLEGRTLKQLVGTEAPLDPVRAIDIIIQVLKAARFAHKRGIIHRDIKPHNVIVDSDDRVKVTDFGIARADTSEITETGAIMGTAHYLSPEQAQGHPVGPAADLYSVGIVLYELLTGHVPFEADQAVTVALKHVQEQPKPPSIDNPRVPPELDDAVLRALSKQPSDRYADDSAFIGQLESVRSFVIAAPVGEQTISFDAGAGLPPEHYVPYNETQGYPTMNMPPQPPPGVSPAVQSGDDNRRKSKKWPWILVALIVVLASVAVMFGLMRHDQAIVPKVVGLSDQAALTILQNEGFDARTERVANADVPAGTVQRQSPLPGRKVSKKTTITLVVSSGPGEVAVPDVVEFTSATAVRRLEQLGFRVKIEEQFSREIPEQKVITTSPAAGIKVEKGSEVKLIVSKGVERVEIPDVIGKMEADALEELTKAGFNVRIKEQIQLDEVPGTVLKQSPKAGVKRDQGDTVEITVASKGTEVELPDVIGSRVNDAVSALSGLGLKVELSTRTVTDPTQNGQVLNQSPKGGKRVTTGSAVKLTVGQVEVTAPAAVNRPLDSDE